LTLATAERTSRAMTWECFHREL